MTTHTQFTHTCNSTTAQHIDTNKHNLRTDRHTRTQTRDTAPRTRFNAALKAPSHLRRRGLRLPRRHRQNPFQDHRMVHAIIYDLLLFDIDEPRTTMTTSARPSIGHHRRVRRRRTCRRSREVSRRGSGLSTGRLDRSRVNSNGGGGASGSLALFLLIFLLFFGHHACAALLTGAFFFSISISILDRETKQSRNRRAGAGSIRGGQEEHTNEHTERERGQVETIINNVSFACPSKRSSCYTKVQVQK